MLQEYYNQFPCNLDLESPFVNMCPNGLIFLSLNMCEIHTIYVVLFNFFLWTILENVAEIKIQQSLQF